MSDYRTLRLMIRKIILETLDEEELPYEDTVMPGDTASKKKVMAEPDLSQQPERNDYLKKKYADPDKKVKSQSDDETDEGMGDEMNAVGGAGGIGGGIRGHMGGAWKPRQKSKPMKSKNAMGDEYDE